MQIISDAQSFSKLDLPSKHYLLQESVESRVDRYTLSVRSVAFGGEFICMYANLSTGLSQTTGILAFVSPGETLRV